MGPEEAAAGYGTGGGPIRQGCRPLGAGDDHPPATPQADHVGMVGADAGTAGHVIDADAPTTQRGPNLRGRRSTPEGGVECVDRGDGTVAVVLVCNRR